MNLGFVKLKTELLVLRATANQMKKQEGSGGPRELELRQPSYSRKKDGQIYTGKEGYMGRRMEGMERGVGKGRGRERERGRKLLALSL